MPKARIYPPGQPPPPTGDGTLLLIQTDPYVWLYAVDLPTTPPTKLRVAAYQETVNFGRTSLGAVIPYVPFSVTHGETRSDSEASISNVSLSAQNLTREMSALVQTYNYLIGQTVRISLVRISEMPDGDARLEDVYEVLDGEVTETTATLTLGQAALQNKSFPDHRITRDYCTADYGGVYCGYDTKRAGAIQTCTKLYDGPLGCIKHGDDEVLASLPRNHPKRFRSFLGVQRQGGTGT